jgi:hypothetical protein
MPETNFRALCAELVRTSELPSPTEFFELRRRARTALNQPEPEGSSEDELIEYWYEDCEGEGDEGILRFARYIRRTNHPEENK